MHTEHAEHGGVIIRHNATRRQCGDNRGAGQIGERLHLGTGVGTHCATAHVEHRAERVLEQSGGIVEHAAMRLGGRVVAGQNHALRPAVIHGAVLGGLRQIHDHRSGTAGTRDVVCLGEHTRNVLRVGDQIGMLGDRVGGTHDVGLLERVGANGVDAHLTGDHDHRDRIHVRVGDGGDHVRGARA